MLPGMIPILSASGVREVTLVGIVTGTAINGGDVTLDLTALTGGSDSAPSLGDIVLVASAVGNNLNAANPATPSGWTNEVSISSDDSFDTALDVFYKIMGSTPDTSVICAGTGGADDATSATAFVFRGVNQGAPFASTTATSTGIGTAVPNPPSVTVGGGMYVGIGAACHSRNADAFTSSDLDNFTSQSGQDVYDIALGVGTSATVNDPAAFTFTGSDSAAYSWCAATIALAIG